MFHEFILKLSVLWVTGNSGAETRPVEEVTTGQNDPVLKVPVFTGSFAWESDDVNSNDWKFLLPSSVQPIEAFVVGVLADDGDFNFDFVATFSFFADATSKGDEKMEGMAAREVARLVSIAWKSYGSEDLARVAFAEGSVGKLETTHNFLKRQKF